MSAEGSSSGIPIFPPPPKNPLRLQRCLIFVPHFLYNLRYLRSRLCSTVGYLMFVR